MSSTGHAEDASPLHAALRRNEGDLLVYQSGRSLFVSNQNSPRLHSHNIAMPGVEASFISLCSAMQTVTRLTAWPFCLFAGCLEN
jgi:hypothetical protein